MVVSGVIKKITFWTIFLFLTLVSTSFAGYNTYQNIPNSYTNIGVPFDLTVLPDGNIWYVDYAGNRLVKINQSKEILRTVGRSGSNEGEFASQIIGLTVDSSGKLYVLSDCKVYILDSNGGYLSSWGDCGAEEEKFTTPKGIVWDSFSDTIFISNYNKHNVQHFEKDGTYISSFGTFGSGNGELNEPGGLTTDSTGNVYVTDGSNHRVVVFDSNGVFMFNFDATASGSNFNAVKDIAILSNGQLLVTDQNDPKIHRFESDGTWISSFGTNGTGEDEFMAPQYLTVDDDDNIYVSDWNLNSILKFNSLGIFQWGYRNSGTENGLLTIPTSVAVDSNGDILVLYNGPFAPEVNKYNSSGVYVSTLLDFSDIGEIAAYHMKVDDADKIYISHISGVKVFNSDGTLDFSFGASGTGNGEFAEARGLGILSNGNIVVSDYFNARVQIFDSSGNYISQFGQLGTGNGEFMIPESIYVDGADNIYVVDNYEGVDGAETGRIQKFSSTGVYIEDFDSGSTNRSVRLGGITQDIDGNFFVVDMFGNKVHKYDSTGNFIESFGDFGTGITQFNNPSGITYHPIGNFLLVADDNSSRVHMIAEGVRILNLTPSSDVVNVDTEESLVTKFYDPSTPGLDSIQSKMSFGDYLVADFDVDLSDDRDWSEVNPISLPSESKTMIQGLNPSDAPGVSEVYDLYVVKKTGNTGVVICPEVDSLSEITSDCTGNIPLNEGDFGLSVVNISGTDYYKVSDTSAEGVLGVTTVQEPPVDDENEEENEGNGNSNSNSNSESEPDVVYTASNDINNTEEKSDDGDENEVESPISTPTAPSTPSQTENTQQDKELEKQIRANVFEFWWLIILFLLLIAGTYKYIKEKKEE